VSAALTRVALVFVAQRMNVYLRFGGPISIRTIDARRRVAAFTAGSVFCRIDWRANDYGTTQWQLAVLQAVRPGEPMQRMAGVVPGAALLLCAEGAYDVHAALRLIDSIEAQRIDPADIPERYWRAMHNRLAARAAVSPYAPDRHAAHLARCALQ
jgi:hypothetical protein